MNNFSVLNELFSALPAAAGHAAAFNEIPALAVAIALGAGMLCQAVAHHLRIPGIVVLLLVGVILGPDVANVIDPDSLGPALQTIVGFAVAVVLFEGGMQLNLQHVWNEGRAIRGIVTIGALITGVLATVAVKYIFGWSWTIAPLFGSLVMVTGPTVINPLVKRIRLESRTATVLEAEGIIVDAIGAVVAVVALEFALLVASQQDVSMGIEVSKQIFDVLERLGVGTLVGLGGGAILIFLLRYRNLIPEGSESVFILAQVMLIFQVSNFLSHESGIAAAIVAGTVVGNIQSYSQHHIMEFKEQLTTLFIGMLFVLLAASVRLDNVVALGWRGVAVVALLMVVIRPLAVFVSTAGSDLSTNQKTFIAWLGPRGIIAAAVASFFAVRLSDKDINEGVELQALIFLVISATVIISGLSAGLVARMLGLQRPKDNGWVILGANELGRTLGKVLADSGEEVVLLDSSAIVARQARAQGLEVLVGNALDEELHDKANVGIRRGVIGCTPNEEVNLLFARKARAHTGIRRFIVGLRTADDGITPGMVEHEGGNVLFGSIQDIRMWSEQIRRRLASLEDWVYHDESGGEDISSVTGADSASLALVVHRDNVAVPVDETMEVRTGDRATFLINEERREDADERLMAAGWRKADDVLPDSDADGADDGPVLKLGDNV